MWVVIVEGKGKGQLWGWSWGIWRDGWSGPLTFWSERGTDPHIWNLSSQKICIQND